MSNSRKGRRRLRQTIEREARAIAHEAMKQAVAEARAEQMKSMGEVVAEARDRADERRMQRIQQQHTHEPDLGQWFDWEAERARQARAMHENNNDWYPIERLRDRFRESQ